MVKLFSKNSNLCDHNPPTSQTDGQTDRQTTCDRNTALCTKVHRAVKTYEVKIIKFGSASRLVFAGMFHPEILTVHQRHTRTDGQTDDMQSHGTKVHRAVKKTFV